jgi:hypothetical protein
MYRYIINYLMYYRIFIYTQIRKGDTNEDEVPILALLALYLATSLHHYFNSTILLLSLLLLLLYSLYIYLS